MEEDFYALHDRRWHAAQIVGRQALLCGGTACFYLRCLCVAPAFLLQLIPSAARCRGTLAQSTALEFFHRYYAERSLVTNDHLLMSMACLYLAGKVDSDAPKSSRDIVRAALDLVSTREDFDRLIRDKEWVDAARRAVGKAERALLYQLGFRFEDTPAPGVVMEILKNPTITSFLDACSPSGEPERVQIHNLAVWFAMASRSAPLVLQFPQTAIAAACVWVAIKMFAKDTTPLRTVYRGRPWYEQYGIKSQDLESIAAQIASLVEKEHQYAQRLSEAVATGKPLDEVQNYAHKEDADAALTLHPQLAMPATVHGMDGGQSPRYHATHGETQHPNAKQIRLELAEEDRVSSDIADYIDEQFKEEGE
jgi:hypothetical protein